jgi:hypothetical protein
MFILGVVYIVMFTLGPMAQTKLVISQLIHVLKHSKYLLIRVIMLIVIAHQFGIISLISNANI